MLRFWNFRVELTYLSLNFYLFISIFTRSGTTKGWQGVRKKKSRSYGNATSSGFALNLTSSTAQQTLIFAGISKKLLEPDNNKMQNTANQENWLRSGGKLILPALSNSTRLLPSRPRIQRQVLKFQDDLVYTMGNDVSRIPSAIRNTMSHLTSRHMEVSQWQVCIAQRISQADREVAEMEQMKDVVEDCLQDKQLYSQLLSDCVEMGSTLSSARLRQDQAVTELKKEEQLTKGSRDQLQNHISVLLGKLSSLKEIRAQLQDDLQDKGDAIKLLNRCITCEVSTSCSHLPAAQYKPNRGSHDKSHSKNLMLKADHLLLDSMSFRGILQFSLANIKNSQEHQRRSTEYSLRRKIHQLNRVKETLTWEKHRIMKEIADLTKHVQKLESQVRNCECKLHQTIHRLDILNLRRDLYLGQPHISLTQQKQDLANLVAGLRSMLSFSQQEVERAHRRLASLEDKLDKKSQHLEVTQSCQNLHQSSLPTFNRAVVLVNKPRLPLVMGGTHTYLQ